MDLAALAGCIRGRAGLRLLSAERIGNEMRKLVVAPRAVEVATAMQDAGVLPIVLGGVGYLGNFARLVGFESTVASSPSAAIRLAALACAIAEDVQRIAERLRLANSDRDAILAALAAARAISDPSNERAARAVLYRHAPAWQSGIMLAFALGKAGGDEATWRRLYTLPERWTPPRFPLSGRDVLGPGVRPGPAVGEVLRAVESWWIAEDFVPNEAALRTRLQQMIAAVQ
jgi:tRNA nucleotidyltransferase/poly(A) polymerase